MSVTPLQEIERMNQSQKKIIRPVELPVENRGKVSSAGADNVDRKLQAVEIQELSRTVENGEPCLRKIQAGDSLMVEGGKSGVGVVVVQEVRWSAAKRDVELCVVPLLRTAEVANPPSENLREVFYSHETTQILARKVMHPCKVWFLAADGLPVTLSGSGKSRHERYRAGFLCRQVVLKQGKKFLPLAKLPPSSPMFEEITKLVQNTNKELRTLEEKEDVPIGKRTGFPPPQFLPKEGPMGLSLALSSPPASSNPVARLSTATSGATEGRQDAAAKQPAKPTPAAAPGAPMAGRTVSEGQAERVVGTSSGGGKLEVGTSKAAEINWNADVISEAESAANNVAWSLGLEVDSENAWDNIRNYVNVLLHSAGTTAEAVDNSDGQPVKRLKRHLLDAARQSVRLPALKVVESLGKAVSSASTEVQERLSSYGLHRVLGAWLCCLPEDCPESVRYHLLRALRKGPFNVATLFWVVRFGIFAHVCHLTEAPQQAVKEQAVALKVSWQDANEKLQPPTPQKLAPDTEAATSSALPSRPAPVKPAPARQLEMQQQEATADNSDEDMVIFQRLAKRPTKQTSHAAGADPSEASMSHAQTDQPQPSASGRPAAKAASLGHGRSLTSGDSLSGQSRTGKRRLSGPEGPFRKTRTADYLHKTTPSPPQASQMPRVNATSAADQKSSYQNAEDVSSPPATSAAKLPYSPNSLKTDDLHRSPAKSALSPAYQTPEQHSTAPARPQQPKDASPASKALPGHRSEAGRAGGEAAPAASQRVKPETTGPGEREVPGAGRGQEVVRAGAGAAPADEASSSDAEEKEDKEDALCELEFRARRIAPLWRGRRRLRQTARKTCGGHNWQLARPPQRVPAADSEDLRRPAAGIALPSATGRESEGIAEGAESEAASGSGTQSGKEDGSDEGRGGVGGSGEGSQGSARAKQGLSNGAEALSQPMEVTSLKLPDGSLKALQLAGDKLSGRAGGKAGSTASDSITRGAVCKPGNGPGKDDAALEGADKAGSSPPPCLPAKEGTGKPSDAGTPKGGASGTRSLQQASERGVSKVDKAGNPRSAKPESAGRAPSVKKAPKTGERAPGKSSPPEPSAARGGGKADKAVRTSLSEGRDEERESAAVGEAGPSGSQQSGGGDQALFVNVAVGTGKRRREGRFNVISHMVTSTKGKLMTAQQFVESAERKGPWRENIVVTGDCQRLIGEWLEDCCTVCKLPHDAYKMLMCSNGDCELLWHIYCLQPPLKSLPPADKDWFCPECTSKGKSTGTPVKQREEGS